MQKKCKSTEKPNFGEIIQMADMVTQRQNKNGIKTGDFRMHILSNIILTIYPRALVQTETEFS